MIVVVVVRYLFARRLTVIHVRKDTVAQHGSKNLDLQDKPYDEVRHQFDNEYDRANPVTSREKIKEYLKWILSKKNFQKFLLIFREWDPDQDLCF